MYTVNLKKSLIKILMKTVCRNKPDRITRTCWTKALVPLEIII